MRKVIVLLISLIPFTGNSQLSFNQLVHLKLGDNFAKSSEYLKQNLTGKFTLDEGDFFSAYKLNFEDIPIDYYGKADCEFFYAKNQLLSVMIQFNMTDDSPEFSIEDKVIRLTTLFQTDLEKKYQLQRLKKFDLTPAKIKAELPKRIKSVIEKNDDAIGVIVGNYRIFSPSNFGDSRVIAVQLSVGRSIWQDNGKQETVEAKTSVDLWITNVKLWDTYLEVKNSFVRYKTVEKR